MEIVKVLHAWLLIQLRIPMVIVSHLTCLYFKLRHQTLVSQFSIGYQIPIQSLLKRNQSNWKVNSNQGRFLYWCHVNILWNQVTGETASPTNLETQESAWNNHSPTCMVPPVWNILASCEEQYLDLAPYDIDGDSISCRWADLSEVGLAYYRPGNAYR